MRFPFLCNPFCITLQCDLSGGSRYSSLPPPPPRRHRGANIYLTHVLFVYETVQCVCGLSVRIPARLISVLSPAKCICTGEVNAIIFSMSGISVLSILFSRKYRYEILESFSAEETRTVRIYQWTKYNNIILLSTHSAWPYVLGVQGSGVYNDFFFAGLG